MEDERAVPVVVVQPQHDDEEIERDFLTITQNQEGNFTDSRGLPVITATRANILMLAGYIAGSGLVGWQDYDWIVLVHPALTRWEMGSIHYRGSGMYMVCRPTAPPRDHTEKAHPVSALNIMRINPKYEFTESSGVFCCTAQALGNQTTGVGPSRREAKSEAARQLLLLVPKPDEAIHLRMVATETVKTEVLHTFDLS